jgi:hypothetical protein
MNSRLLPKTLPCLLLSGASCAVQPLGAGNAQGRVKAAATVLASAACCWLSVPHVGAPLPILEDPSLHQRELATLQEHYRRALGTTAFAAALDWTQKPVWPPADPLADQDWSCDPRASPLSIWAFSTEADHAVFRAHVDRQKARFAALAAASAREVAERERILAATRAGHGIETQDWDPAPDLDKQELALRVALLLDQLYQPLHRLLEGVCPEVLKDLEAIRALDQGVLKVFQTVTPRLEREKTHNLVLVKILELERERAGRKLEQLKVRRRLCVTEALDDRVGNLERVLRNLGRDLAGALGRAKDLDAASAAVRALMDWPGTAAQADPGADPPRHVPDEEARQPVPVAAMVAAADPGRGRGLRPGIEQRRPVAVPGPSGPRGFDPRSMGKAAAILDPVRSAVARGPGSARSAGITRARTREIHSGLAG